MDDIRVAVVHEWLVDYSGSERVVEQILEIFPKADLYAVVEFLPDTLKGFIKHKQVRTTFIQNLPFAKRHFRKYLPLMPLAVEQLDLSEYDLVISSAHAVSKGVVTGPDQLHISYVHSPMRYAWDFQHRYLEESGLANGLRSIPVRWMLHRLRLWDTNAANRVDFFVANSGFIARRVLKSYRREARVIYPPVDTGAFELGENKDDFFFTASRMSPYKRVDLVVEAFRHMPEKRLVVIGDGVEFDKVKRKAGPNVTLLGYQPFEVLRDHMQRTRAFIFAAEEDFGIAPVEAQACGTPVIAFGRGGVRESVQGLDCEEPTGVFFERQSVEDIVLAVKQFEEHGFRINPVNCRNNALKFGVERFRTEFATFMAEKWSEFQAAKGKAVQP